MKNLFIKAGILNSDSSNAELVRESKSILLSMGLKNDPIRYRKQLETYLNSRIANNKMVVETKAEIKEEKPVETEDKLEEVIVDSSEIETETEENSEPVKEKVFDKKKFKK